MPKYFFQVQDGEPRYKVPIELVTDDAARREAERISAAFKGAKVVVTNEHGTFVGEAKKP